jgi:hypothetical protein
MKERGHLEDISTDGIIILKSIFKERYGKAMDSSFMARDRNKFRVLLKAVMNLQIP